MLASLSSGIDDPRPCYVVEEVFTTREIDGTVIRRGDRKFLLAALSVDGTEAIQPPTEDDTLTVSDPDDDSQSTELIMASEPSRLAPAGFVVYYELHCRER